DHTWTTSDTCFLVSPTRDTSSLTFTPPRLPVGIYAGKLVGMEADRAGVIRPVYSIAETDIIRGAQTVKVSSSTPTSGIDRFPGTLYRRVNGLWSAGEAIWVVDPNNNTSGATLDTSIFYTAYHVSDERDIGSSGLSQVLLTDPGSGYTGTPVV